VGWGRLRRPGWRGKALTGRGPGRRKRPPAPTGTRRHYQIAQPPSTQD